MAACWLFMLVVVVVSVCKPKVIHTQKSGRNVISSWQKDTRRLAKSVKWAHVCEIRDEHKTGFGGVREPRKAFVSRINLIKIVWHCERVWPSERVREKERKERKGRRMMCETKDKRHLGRKSMEPWAANDCLRWKNLLWWKSIEIQSKFGEEMGKSSAEFRTNTVDFYGFRHLSLPLFRVLFFCFFEWYEMGDGIAEKRHFRKGMPKGNMGLLYRNRVI